MGSEPGQALIPPELAALVAAKTGVDFGRGGLDTTFAEFVRKRCLARGQTVAAYAKDVLSGDREEERVLLQAISIPHTWFFRDRTQLELALDYVQSTLGVPRCVRVWIPGCATGEDVYSVVILAMIRGLDISVLGTDISETALTRARAAAYEASSFREVPPEALGYFHESGGRRAPNPDVCRKATFESHNLMAPPRAAPSGWDLVICRNVVIYFSRGAALECAERLGSALGPRGMLVLGAGELAAESPRGLDPLLLGQRVMLVRAQPSPAPLMDTKELLPLPDPGRRARRRAVTRPEMIVPAPSARDPFPILLGAKDLTEATLDLEALMPASPTNACVPLCLGIVHFARGDYERAFEDLGRAAALDPTLWPVALYQGLCLERFARPDAAARELQKAQDLLIASAEGATLLPFQFAALAEELLELALARTRTRPDQS